jgi:hypothetical protein
MFRILGVDCIRGVRRTPSPKRCSSRKQPYVSHMYRMGCDIAVSIPRDCVKAAGIYSLAERHAMGDAGVSRFPSQDG